MTPLPPTLFEANLPGLGRPLTPSEGGQFVKYLNLLIKWQRTQRLVGSVTPSWVIQNIFLDSLCFLAALPRGVSRVADIGSGAGVPGIPLAIVRPHVDFSLIEARERRASFLSTVVRELGLTRVEVLGQRVEALEASYVEAFDAVVMRCAGNVDQLVSGVSRILRPGGVIVASASPSSRDDAERVQVPLLDGTVRTLRRAHKP